MSACRKPVQTLKVQPPAAAASRGRLFCRPGFLCLLLGLATLAVYLPVAWNGFVNYDNSDYITANAHVLGGLKWETVTWAFTTGHASNWHPLTWLSHALDCTLFGQRPGPQHLVSVALHIANTLLLFFLLRRMTGSLWRSALAAAFFALHPLHVESVAWISERKDVLSGLFFVLTLTAYVIYVEKTRPANGRPPDAAPSGRLCGGPVFWYGLSLLFFCLGLMSKPMLVTVPFVLLLLDAWPLRRFPRCGSLAPSDGERAGVRGRPGMGRAVGSVAASPSPQPSPHLMGRGSSHGRPSPIPARSDSSSAERESSLAPSDGERAGVRGRPGMGRAVGSVAASPSPQPSPHLMGRGSSHGRPSPIPARSDSSSAERESPLAPSDGERAGVRGRPGMGRALIEKLPFLALGAASSVVTFLVQRKGGAVSTALPLDARVGNALVSYVRYLGKTLWPAHLSVLYPHPGHWPLWQVIAAACLLAGVCAVVLWRARAVPCLAAGWFWFAGMLVPVIGLVQVGIQSMADRYMYLPMIGLSLALLWGVPELVPQRLWRPRLGAAAMVLALGACAWMSARQVRYWHDTEALFARAVKVTKRNYLAYNNLGFYQSRQGRPAEAMENYLRSLEINPRYEDALNNVGYALAGRKKYAEAMRYYEAALAIQPNHPEVHNNLGNALSELGRIDEAITHYWITLGQKPDHADANNNLGIALAMKGQLDQAILHFRKAIQSNPGDASAHSNLGNALAVQHNLDGAIQEYNLALRLRPNDAQAHNNLGNALAGLGKLDEAIAHYHDALRLNPDNPEAHANLAGALASQGNLPLAIEQFLASLRCNPNSPDTHYHLAQVLLKQGRRDEAAAHLAAALQLRPGFPEARRDLEALRAAPAQR